VRPALKAAFIQGVGGLGCALAAQLQTDNSIDKIFLATRDPSALPKSLLDHPHCEAIHWDLEKPESISKAVDSLQSQNVDLVLIINSQGLLQREPVENHWLTESAVVAPEKRLEELSATGMLQSYYANAIVPMLTSQALIPLLRTGSFCWIVNISAKIGSIGDNQIGGWYSYRAAKAALNMLGKTLSLELSKRQVKAGVLSMHPGTVATNLSEPFTSAQTPRLQTPSEAATALLKVIDARSEADSGTFWSYDGNSIPW